jgi:hypothetical protein
MGGNRNKRGGRELGSAHPYVGGARPGMVTGRSYKLNLRTRINTTTPSSTKVKRDGAIPPLPKVLMP